MASEIRKRTAIIIGAGPAGLTAAHELIKKSDITPIIIEKLNMLGGLSRTINYKGNRIDIGGHRFFSRSNKILDWWLTFLPPETDTADINIHYQNKSKKISNSYISSESPDDIMLVRNR
jgi:protoporphyrinogen oxidase